MTTESNTNSRNAWLESRKRGIGGSDIGAICKLSPYATPLDVYLDKLGLREETPDNFAMKVGRLLESVVAEEFGNLTGCEVIEPTLAIYKHSECDYFAASIDRFTVLDGEHAVLECKTVSGFAVKAFTDDAIPLHYYAQLQWYMGITGLSKGVLAWVDLNTKNLDFKIWNRDAEFIAWLQDEGRTFWENHIQKRIKPDAVNLADLKHLFPTPQEFKTVELAEANGYLYHDLKEAYRELMPLQEKANALKLQLQLLMKDAEILTIGGEIVATFKSDKNGKRTFKLK